MNKADGAGTLERLGTTVDGVRLWLSKAWRMGVLMANGAYLLAERRRLFVKLGEETYRKLKDGSLRDPELKPLVTQLEKLTKKVEIEEMLIRSLRFGGRGRRASDNPGAADSAPSKEEVD